jgi:sulfite exporter TauE/SafE
MEMAAVNSPAAAFVAGLITSLHCVGMCGPLACALMPVRRDQGDPLTVSSVYHLARLASYAVLGGLAGGLGQAPLHWLNHDVLRWLPWVLVLFFVALAFRWDRLLRRPALLGGLTLRLSQWAGRRPRLEAAAALGFATPLLPCGPLYFIVSLALLSGSALRGLEFMLAFGLGTVPLLWLAQSQFQWIRRKLSPLWLDRLRLGFALGTALIIAWRLRSTLGFNGPDVNNFVCCF